MLRKRELFQLILYILLLINLVLKGQGKIRGAFLQSCLNSPSLHGWCLGTKLQHY